eukprot:12048395-Ditylum_brightwellii.AAC.1
MKNEIHQRNANMVNNKSALHSRMQELNATAKKLRQIEKGQTATNTNYGNLRTTITAYYARQGYPPDRVQIQGSILDFIAGEHRGKPES